jgi:hypothetical protein
MLSALVHLLEGHGRKRSFLHRSSLKPAAGDVETIDFDDSHAVRGIRAQAHDIPDAESHGKPLLARTESFSPQALVLEATGAEARRRQHQRQRGRWQGEQASAINLAVARSTHAGLFASSIAIILDRSSWLESPSPETAQDRLRLPDPATGQRAGSALLYRGRGRSA